jgi:transketolase
MLNRAKAHNSQEVYMDALLKKQLEIAATKVRMGVIEGVHAAKAGHPGGSLSVADTLTYLYMHRMNVDPKNPTMPDRDRLVLSKGHTAPALYAVLAERGFFPVEELKTLRKIGSRLQGHPSMGKLPGIDMSTGSLGQGISTACGMALSGKISSDTYKVYTVLGDGEIEEGQVWEAAMFAAHYKLDNLVAVVDNNGLQIDGKISEVMSPYPIDEKFKAFGWHVICIDGHDFDQIEAAFNEAETVLNQPTVIIQKSVKGKGVSFMENQVGWHGKAPNDEEYAIAMKELGDHLAQLEK